MSPVAEIEVRRLQGRLDLLDLHRRYPQRYPFLLESVAQGTAQACYDILFAHPGAELRLDDQGLHGAGAPGQGDFLDALDAWWRELRSPSSATEMSRLPFRGGWFLYLGYELAGQVEPRLRLPDLPAGWPVAVARRVPAAVLVDRRSGDTLLMAESARGDLLDAMVGDIDALKTTARPAARPRVQLQEEDAEAFLGGVRRIREYIREGDVFQVNLSRGWSGRLLDGLDASALYASLRASNPAPFAGLARLDDTFSVISSSPERLLRVRAGAVDTRPIAGTHPRATDADQDAALSRQLMQHPKERAEHIMLIDLERNDLGRVCRPGSVEVDELMGLESYAHVHHIVSNVRGELLADATPGQAIRAVFPGGTITGCPKVRCMEIIAELERTPRGAYTGSMGYLNRDGDLDLNILIRSMQLAGEQLSFRAGAGIVWDSRPECELAETRAKARGLCLSLCEV